MTKSNLSTALQIMDSHTNSVCTPPFSGSIIKQKSLEIPQSRLTADLATDVTQAPCSLRTTHLDGESQVTQTFQGLALASKKIQQFMPDIFGCNQQETHSLTLTNVHYHKRFMCSLAILLSTTISPSSICWLQPWWLVHGAAIRLI